MNRNCDCKNPKYMWRDIAKIETAEKLITIDEPVELLEDGTFDVQPIYDRLMKTYNIEDWQVALATFEKGIFDDEEIKLVWGDKELGCYCGICGGEYFA